MDRVLFNLWSEERKTEYLRDYGTMVARRYDRLYGFELYQFEDFYAELQYYVKDGTHKRIITFDDPAYLDPYLGAINISGLIGIPGNYGPN